MLAEGRQTQEYKYLAKQLCFKGPSQYQTCKCPVSLAGTALLILFKMLFVCLID